MTRELVLVHGRSQQGKDSIALKGEWIHNLKEGLAKSGLELPIDETSIRFPFYGDTLMDLVAGRADEDVAEVVVRGTGQNESAQAFLESVVLEVKEEKRINDEEALAAAGPADLQGRGFQNSRLVLGVLRFLDAHVPMADAPALALATNDVYHYLNNPGVSIEIDDGVRDAMTRGVESVVVGHSLGSVVAYKLLLKEGLKAGWKVPLFVTLGSPLGINAIRRKVSVNYPTVAEHWFNALDPNDVVALRPLKKPWFDTQPTVVNKVDVDNKTPNKHGISGYLSDPEVSRRIYDALIGDSFESPA